MKQFIGSIKESYSTEKNILAQNKSAVNKRNLRIIKLILFGVIIIFGGSLASSFLVTSVALAGYMPMQTSYVVVLTVVCMVLLLLKFQPDINSIYIIYIVYTIGTVYCIFTSAFILPHDISVTILVLIFHIPVLYMDKSIRINGYTIFIAAAYIGVMISFKDKSVLVEEIINTISFSILGLIIGKFTRESQLENYAIKSKLEHNAYIDYTTNLENRRKLFEELELNRNSPSKKKITGFAMMDIDFFKKYNDAYGHQAGDETLRKIGDCFATYHAQYGINFYRYGGEEFLAIFYNAPPKETEHMAEHIRQSIEQMNIEHKNSNVGVVTVSVGVAMMNDEVHVKYEEFISRADKALYEAKSEGKNRVIVYKTIGS